MSVVAIDTHAFIKRMTGAGMPEAQAEALAETLAEPLLPISRDAVVESVERLGRSIDRRFKAVDQRFADLEAKVDAGLSEMRELLQKIIDGQTVLHQNDMELKRRLDSHKIS